MEIKYIDSIPVIPLRGLVILPGEVINFDLGRTINTRAVLAAMQAGGSVFLTSQKNIRVTNAVNLEDLFEYGTLCTVKQTMKLPGSESVRVLCEGNNRGKLTDVTLVEPFMTGSIEYYETDECPAALGEVYRKELSELVGRFAASSKRLAPDILSAIEHAPGYASYADAVAAHTLMKQEFRQKVLEAIDPCTRMELVIKIVSQEIDMIQIDKHIQEQTKKNIDKAQKEYYLREQMKVIRTELGEDAESEADEFRKRMEKKVLPEEVKAQLVTQIDRFAALPMGSHEAPATRALIECILDLPWTESTKDNIDIDRAQRILDRDHYGMRKAKERIIEHLAVSKRTGNLNGQIICFVGPPGVGKTSISSCIAEAVGRKFVRMSLGGIDDEAEIRGHRRTYIGAMPGRIIAAMRQAGTVNPVILFDEIDKLNKNVHGDPAAAMLEVLDSAQNSTFRDHFLELPYDLSKVMFITTANTLDTIPRPLLDRMEIIEVSGYLPTEKLQIAKRHLLAKQLKKHGITKSMLSIRDDALNSIIEGYTRESGVRELDRTLATICRKACCDYAAGKLRVQITQKKLVEYLGTKRYTHDEAEFIPTVGVVNGLAWTAVGGELLNIEVQTVNGNGKLELTGQLGEVMRESAAAAFTYVKSISASLGIADDFFPTHDIHVHCPEGAVKKDGPSAGITLATAITSAITGISVNAGIAMTGEITLRGNVLPVGGLREKLLAALRAGIHTVVVPEKNRAQISEIEHEITDGLTLVYASKAITALQTAMILPKNDICISLQEPNPMHIAMN